MSTTTNNNNNNKDIIVGQITGNGNIIGKNVNITHVNAAKSYGFFLLSDIFFNENKDTSTNFNNWLNGDRLNLSSIFYGLDYRRENIITDIKTKLNSNQILMLLGLTGFSKSTILKEIACDYHRDGYIVLFNDADIDIGDPYEVTDFIIEIVKKHEKVLLVIDDVHTLTKSRVYYIIELLESYNKKNNIKILLSARQPDLDFLLTTDKKYQLINKYRNSMNSFFRKDFLFFVPPFNKPDIKGFIKKYESYWKIKLENIDNYVEQLWLQTKGNPLLIKFFIIGKGLNVDVEDRYSRYLYDNKLETFNEKKVELLITTFVLDFANIPITNYFLDETGLLDFANSLKDAILINENNNWRTLPTRWNLELLSLLFNKKDINNKKRIEQLFLIAFNHIFKHFEVETIYSVIQATTLSLAYRFRSQGILEKVIEDNIIKSEILTEEQKTNILYIIYFPTYPPDIRNVKMLNYLKTHKPTNNYIVLYNIGFAYSDKAFNEPSDEKIRDEYLNKSIEFYNLCLEQNPKHVPALSNKANSLMLLGKYEEAKTVINNAVEIYKEDDIVWYNKGMVHLALKEFPDALASFDKTTLINEKYIHAWLHKAVCYNILKNKKMESNCLDMVIKEDVNFPLLSDYHRRVHAAKDNINNRNRKHKSKMFIKDSIEPKFSEFYYTTNNTYEL